MSIGLGIFLSVVLILAVYHKGFRKVLVWSSAATAALALLSAGIYFGHLRYETWKAERTNAREQAAEHAGMIRCMSRLGTPWVEGSPPALPEKYFDNLQACTIAPDYDPFVAFGGHRDWFSTVNSLPAGYTLNAAGLVVPKIDLSAGLVPIAPCRDDIPLGFVAEEPCVLSGRRIDGFRREMCIGTIRGNGDCVVKSRSGSWGPTIQICPYGLAVNARGECPSWANVDVAKEREKLQAYRKRQAN